MKKIFGKNTLLHLAVIAIFMTITLVYFYPLLEGKDLIQGDVVNADGMSKELKDYHKATGEYAYWTNSMFAGMPAYQIFGPTAPNIYFYIGQSIQQPFPYFTYAIILMALICFYILLSTLGYSHVLAAIGAFAFAFASYNMIIIEAGHITKAYAIAIMPLVIAGFIQTYRGKYLFGGLLTAIGLGMNIAQNHVQITYYIGLTLGLFVLVEFIFSIKEKTLAIFAKATGTIIIAVILAVIPNISDLFYTYDYGKESTRSQSELTNTASKGSGLDQDYAFMWSYGKMESFTLLIPNFNGGSSNSELSKSSNLYAAFKSNGVPDQQATSYVKSAPTYWGDQPFTSGPVYAGAIICFLFVLGLFIIPGKYKWWLLSATALGIILSWGKNFPFLNDFFFNHLPGYNKFRTVSMSLIISCFTMVLLALMALKEVIAKSVHKDKVQKSMIIALASTAGVSLFFLLFGGSIFSYSSNGDAQMLKQGMPQWFIDGVIADRASMFRMDCLRTIGYILVAFGALWMYINSKFSKTVTLSVIAIAMVLDLWLVDTRYLNGNDFKPKRSVVNAIPESDIDLSIKQDTDLSYRIFNVAGNPFNDSRTSYYHKSIGGYHGAKLRRYQEVVDAQFSKNMNVKVLNMLNTKYFIAPSQQEGGDVQIQRNVAALGNAWFIDTVKIVENADAEMASLRTFEPATTAILNKEFSPMVKSWQMGKDTTSTIKLVEYKPDYLKYEANTKKVEIAVFSEIYYPKYWNVTIDGQKAEMFRVNYILRALVIPQGNHKIEFKFLPQPWITAQKVALWGSMLVGLLILLYLVWIIRKTLKLKK
ncbi:MAG: YfhO family protein [Bacteroidota bacterium]